ncbi:MAG: Abortive infection protein [Herbinix sp.]|nr:Abortive infection protein [Herbinix sp.]
MKLNQRKHVTIIIIIIAACSFMAFVDAIWSPEYFIKSFLKLFLFFILPASYAVISKHFSLKELLVVKNQSILIPLILGAGVYLFILGAYYVLGPYFDFSNVTVALSENYGVKKDNFIAVALYISFINSFLEEIFFRGFAFLILKKFTSRRVAYLFSAASFSLYHVAIMSDWFHIMLFLLLILSLFVAGLLFNWFDEKRNTVYTSWLVHMAANLATNTIGFMLFGIL